MCALRLAEPRRIRRAFYDAGSADWRKEPERPAFPKHLTGVPCPRCQTPEVRSNGGLFCSPCLADIAAGRGACSSL